MSNSDDDRPDWVPDIRVKPTKPKPILPHQKADRIGPRQRVSEYYRSKDFFGKPCAGGCGTILTKSYRGITGMCRPCAVRNANNK